MLGCFCVCQFLYAFVKVCVFMSVSVCVHMRVFTCMYVRVFLCMCTYICVCVGVHVRVYACVCACACMRVHARAWVNVCVRVCVAQSWTFPPAEEDRHYGSAPCPLQRQEMAPTWLWVRSYWIPWGWFKPPLSAGTPGSLSRNEVKWNTPTKMYGSGGTGGRACEILQMLESIISVAFYVFFI